ncbi:hypothetical protein [Burkholderia cepacia]|uniref:hypothetical protein n=1 Tax=Burkholderia cepacia TaxID=292 RepID=UPI000650E072|nr:hypothetical protein [Burkholderia cepacia]
MDALNRDDMGSCPRRRAISMGHDMQAQWAITYKTETGFDVEIIDASNSDEAWTRARLRFGSNVVEVERVA